MTLRMRIFALVSTLVAVTVLLVTWTVSSRARTAFEALDGQRRAALVSQFRRDFDREGEEVVRRLDRVATSDAVGRIAFATGTARANAAPYINEAAAIASAAGLDFLDLVAPDGAIVSSAEWPARFGYQHPWAAHPHANERAAFLELVELPNGAALGLMAVRSIAADSERRLVLSGGRRLDEHFLQSLVLPAGMRALLYRNVDPEISGRELVDANGSVAQATNLEPLISRVRQTAAEATETIERPGSAELFQGIPLKASDGRVVGVLLVGSSNREVESLVQRIRWSGGIFGALAIAAGLILSYLLAARVTRPVEELARVARAVADGDWDAQPDVRASGEIGALAGAFAVMTRQLVDQRDRLVQAERVAAWRELARRLAHELKNPLFPLRITIDNLRRARSLQPQEFDEVFNESVTTLGTGFANLNTVIGGFSDFAKMPAPEFQQVALNDVVSQTLKLLQPQLAVSQMPPIHVTSELDAAIGTIRADPEQLSRAIHNLVLNAIDAMPGGGELTVRTRQSTAIVHLEITDTGAGLTEEERVRVFTPYYTTKQHGTGLGLAIVQSIVADHQGRIYVTSTPGRGTTFHIELPCA